MRVLVTGGAGYIGSHMVVVLAQAGHEVVIVDDFSNSSPAVIPRLEELADQTISCHKVDVTDASALGGVFSAEGPFDAVIHFAGLKAVGESTQQPTRYYRTNLDALLSLVEVMAEHECFRLVFSSSATVYGLEAVPPLTEDLPTSSTNPYGWSKVMQEQILRDLAAADPRWQVALLRYFNPVGAHPSGQIGEHPQGIPNNLMPFVAQVAVGLREEVSIFGDDYPTSDGTGERDYIHVMDLAQGHLAALEALDSGESGVRTWNLGTGRPTSVLELIAAFERASGVQISRRVVDRRPGDVAQTWADPSRAETELGWRAELSLDDICLDTWRWQQANPRGYDA